MESLKIDRLEQSDESIID